MQEIEKLEMWKGKTITMTITTSGIDVTECEEDSSVVVDYFLTDEKLVIKVKLLDDEYISLVEKLILNPPGSMLFPFILLSLVDKVQSHYGKTVASIEVAEQYVRVIITV